MLISRAVTVSPMGLSWGILALAFVVGCCPARCLADPLPPPNASFEVDADNDGIPDGWRWSVGAGEARVELDGSTRHSGERSVKLTGISRDARAFLQAEEAVAVKPGKTYVFSCWAKTDGIATGNAVLGIGRYTEEGKWDNWSYTLRVPESTDWHHYEQIFTMPLTTHRAAFRVWIERCEGTAWFDDVSWREYEPPKPGWAMDMRDLGPWQTTNATLTRSEGDVLLRIGKSRAPMALFHLGAMEREIEVDLAHDPFLAVTVERRSGLWGIKTAMGYLQYHTHTSGTSYYDLRPFLVPGGTTLTLRFEVANADAAVVVKEVFGVSQLPPRTDVFTRRSSRYVEGVSLDALKRSLRHPFVAISADEIARARGKGRIYEDYVAGLRRSADRYVVEALDVPNEPSIYSTEYNCPQHGVPLRWRRDHPKEHLCPSGKHAVTGPGLDREWRIRKINGSHRANRQRLQALGMAYVFTGDERYARKSLDILLAYTRAFPGYAWHGGRGDIRTEGNGMRVEYEALGEAGWLAAVARGYDLVAASTGFSVEDHAAIRQMLAEDVRVSLRYDEGMSNRQAHHNLAVASVGLILGDDFLVRRALGSLRYQLEQAVLGDGLWWECSPGYHFYAVRTLREVAETFQRVGIEAVRDLKLRLAFDAPLHFLLPDETLPAVNDSHFGYRLRRDDFEFLYHHFHDPVYAGILSAPGYKRTSGPAYLLYGDELGKRAPMPGGSWHFFQAGMAVLKPAGDSDLSAIMDYGHTVAGHGHMDKLNLVLFAGGRTRLPDIGTRSYFSPVYRFWDRQTLSHNTVVVDERSQKQERGRLSLFDGRGPVQVVQATADEAYPGLNLMRTLFVTSAYTVDIFRVAEDAVDAPLSDAPINEISHWTKYPWGTSSPGSLRRDLTSFERSRDAHTGQYSAMIAQSIDQPARWMTEIRRRTGPNRTIRDGLIPAEAGVEYGLVAWMKTAQATGANHVRLIWLGEGGRTLAGVATQSLTGTQDWTEVRIRGVAPSGTQHLQVACISDRNSGATWFDDICVTRQGDDRNLLVPNPGFELDRESHQTIDYVLHGVGDFACNVPVEPFKGQLGEQTDDPSWDGRNSYRYFREVNHGTVTGGWMASWTDVDQSLSAYLLPEEATEVFTGMGQGPGTTPLPMLMARRRVANTVFGSVLALSDRPDGGLRVSRLRTDASASQAYGIVVERSGEEKARALYAASFMGERVRFEGLTLDGRIGAAGAAGGTTPTKWLYLVDGTSLECAYGELGLPGAYHVTVAGCDDGAKTVAVREELPQGVALAGTPLILDAPLNECFTVDRVSPDGDGSIVHLAGAPNLYLRDGMTARIPARAYVEQLSSPPIVKVCSNAPVTVRLPRGDVERFSYCRSDGTIGELPVRIEGDGVVIQFAGPQQDTLVGFGLDSPEALADRIPPRVTTVLVDGESMLTTSPFLLTHIPQRIELRLKDTSGFDAELSPDAREFARLEQRGEQVIVTLKPGLPGSCKVDVLLCDRSILRNRSEFLLEVALPVSVVCRDGASSGGAAKLHEATALLTGTVSLPKGEYTVNVVSRAFGDGANSLWLTVDGQQVKDPIHIPLERFASSSRSHSLTPELTRLTVGEDGVHTFVLTLREAPGVELDKIQFARDGNVVAEVECESLVGR
ncbi:MAG: hypothetical protein HN742_23805 [Lentisphaerae bacterium]|jgi:hypothetical protein|nr:hypothetical protein [Lentisphaerota bacterium]MBT4822492.1 hypothetical protein [Lentisphaerota bacterium]MBT5612805.1 hypothetical protein [Lentisphaerota bacterium]MBT7057631.1 hypothetical protein [Lentisphaerota bacterium]MBT7844922.1 hypothetical protein [Lentisphaerota bacterium]